MQNPLGVAASARGEVFVLDLQKNRMQVFTKEGVFARVFGSLGDGDGQFYCLYRMCFNSNGQLVVCDHGNDRVHVRREDGGFVPSFEVKGDGDATKLVLYAVIPMMTVLL